MPAGSLTAFVGASGAGKTTAAQLIPKFWEVTDGKICIDGKNILDLKNENLMDLVSFVFQETFTLALIMILKSRLTAWRSINEIPENHQSIVAVVLPCELQIGRAHV